MKKKKEKKTPTYQVTMEQLKAYDQRGYERGRKEAFDYLIVISLIVLRDFFGFGGKRLERFIDGVRDYYESITKKLVDLDEIAEALEEETGIGVRR
ncbi:hypothetical protein [Peptoniphilus duerdenii]|uniref:hypothetical protein n=1 Tax=Peptoniphilus duerdenii TaxID=507750 RepID=UPI0023F09F52|nr:hypothetical protein [Peptoniphilus duerdenii]